MDKTCPWPQKRMYAFARPVQMREQHAVATWFDCALIKVHKISKFQNFKLIVFCGYERNTNDVSEVTLYGKKKKKKRLQNLNAKRKSLNILIILDCINKANFIVKWYFFLAKKYEWRYLVVYSKNLFFFYNIVFT